MVNWFLQMNNKRNISVGISQKGMVRLNKINRLEWKTLIYSNYNNSNTTSATYIKEN